MNMEKLNSYSANKEATNCLICHNAICTSNCSKGLDPAKIIRSFCFDNRLGAAHEAKYGEECSSCEEKTCMNECVAGKLHRPVNIPSLIEYIGKLKYKEKTIEKVDLGIQFCGIKCENPFFLSSSVVGSNYEMVAKAFDMGWSGVAFKTIGTFVPDEVSPRFAKISKDASSFMGFKNIEQISDHTLEENLGYLKKLKEDYPTKVIVASIMGQTEEEWTYLAKLMTEAGADIIECNFSCPHMSGEGLGSDVGQDPELVARFTRATIKGTHLPILAKMTPNIGNMEIPAIAAIEAGATGIAAINTIKSIMNIDLDNYVSEPQVDGKSSVGGYSGKAVKPIALRFIHDMKKHEMLKDIPISGMGGIETWKDCAEFMALGCENIQITTAVMEYGYRIIEDLIEGLSTYLADKGYEKLSDIVGLALPQVIQANNLNRHSVLYPKIDREKCVACGRCYLSCYDGGHQAIYLDEETNKPKLLPHKCVGCHLCTVVCPVSAITEKESKRVNTMKS